MNEYENTYEEEINLTDLLIYCLKKWRWIVAAMLIVAVFIAVLERGSNKIQTTFKIPASAAEVLTGIILFFMLGCEFFINYKVIVRGRKEA